MKKGKSLIKMILKVFRVIKSLVIWRFQTAYKGEKTVAYLFNITKWKRAFIPLFLKEFEVKFVPFNRNLYLLKRELSRNPNKVFIIWGYNNDDEICRLADAEGIPVYRLEDGFIRSVKLGSMHAAPYSLCLDKKGMYFDSTKPSDLEVLLNTYDFQADMELMNSSEKYMKALIELGVSKYNHVEQQDVESIYGKKTSKRILVIGQVEDDASIRKGSSVRWTNNDLVRLAREENPEAEIIYKPHPDVLTGRRKKQSDPNDIAHLAKVISVPLSLTDSFKTVDHVYTITSLAGFEALMRGIPVTALGAPFYSGWGLTDDRQIVERRHRKLSIQELFAGAYILYPRYADPSGEQSLSIMQIIEKISLNKS